MFIRRTLISLVTCLITLASSTAALAQSQPADSKWVIDLGVGISPSINGNVNSGVLGVYQGQTIAVLPNSYGDVYGTGIDFRFGGGYALNRNSELRGMFIYQSADANLVRLGDYGPSSLYGQYDDYKSIGFDFGYRRYIPISSQNFRVYAEGAIGIADVTRINLTLAAPQANLVSTDTNFYDGTAAFAWSIGAGVLFPVAAKVDINAQLGLRHVGGLADVDQFAGTSLSDINNDSARLTFPIVVGVRFRF